MFKKHNALVSVFLFLLCILAFLPGKTAWASASGSFGITLYEAHYDVQPDGDIAVTETIEFDIDGQINGMFRDVDTNLGRDIPNTPENQVGIDRVSVAVVEGGQERPVFMTDEGAGRQGQFEFYEERSNIYRFKVYEASRNEKKLMRFRYTLTNVVVVYNDIATLNWKMADANWGVPLENVKITITIPEGADQSELRIFSHGDLTGFNEIINNTTFNVQIAQMEPRDTVENLVIFPPDLVPGSQKIINRTELPSILEREGEAAEEANRRREEAQRQVEEARRRREAELRREEQGKALTPLVLIISAIGAALSGFVFFRYGKERQPNFSGDYYRELPGDYTPAVMSYLLNSKIESKDIMATLMDLARKGVITIEPYAVEKRSLFGEKTDTDYRLRSLAGDGDGLSRLTQHEQFLYDWFINDLGNGTYLAMDELEEILKKTKNAYQFNRDYDKFRDYVTGMGESLNFREPNKTPGAGLFYLLAVLLMAFGAVTVFYFRNLLGIAPAAAGLILAAANAAMYFKRKLTQYGADQTAMWKAFRRFLVSFSNLDQAEIPALTIWNHYLVYATSLGVAKEVIDQLPKVYSMQELQDPTFTRTFYPDFYYGRGFVMMDRSINRAVTTATQTIQKAEQVAASRRSSSSGGGGGFSGGSSGGGGGGGGGGVF